jgi:hypothetical protein
MYDFLFRVHFVRDIYKCSPCLLENGIWCVFLEIITHELRRLTEFMLLWNVICIFESVKYGGIIEIIS